MKRFLCLFLSLILVGSAAVPAAASENAYTYSSKNIPLDNGIIIIEETIEHSLTRATGKTVTKRGTIKKDDTVLAVIAFQVDFHYDGTTVTVASKSVTQTDTYNGWNYKQTSFTSSGGTVTLTGKITKLLVLSQSFTLSVTCDKNGNIS